MKQKGYSDFIRAAAIVSRQCPDVYFLLVGEGELRRELEDLTRDLNASDRVIFAGSRSDVEAMFKIMDVFLSTSLWEGLPGVILESMASRVPVIATDIQGSSELVEDGINGILIPPGDPEAAARATIELIENPQKRSALAQRAALTPGDYAIEVVAARYEDIYKKAIKINRTG
jgi:glycosyltransferase involved in cell wall biosynthesis